MFPDYIKLMFKEVFEWMFKNRPHGFVGDFEYEGKKYHVNCKITEIK